MAYAGTNLYSSNAGPKTLPPSPDSTLYQKYLELNGINTYLDDVKITGLAFIPVDERSFDQNRAEITIRVKSLISLLKSLSTSKFFAEDTQACAKMIASLQRFIQEGFSHDAVMTLQGLKPYIAKWEQKYSKEFEKMQTLVAYSYYDSELKKLIKHSNSLKDLKEGKFLPTDSRKKILQDFQIDMATTMKHTQTHIVSQDYSDKVVPLKSRVDLILTKGEVSTVDVDETNELIGELLGTLRKIKDLYYKKAQRYLEG